MEEQLQKAITVLKAGGIVIFPTDTAYGIGCRIDDRHAIDRLFTIRKRPVSQAMPVLVSSKSMAYGYYKNPPEIVAQLMDLYWPGALTIIGPCDPSHIYTPIRGGTETVGLRMPNHNIPLSLITAVGVPVVGPSANFHGETTPYSFDELNPELVRLVDYALPGKATLGIVSTVVDATESPPKIIRQGAVTIGENLLL